MVRADTVNSRAGSARMRRRTRRSTHALWVRPHRGKWIYSRVVGAVAPSKWIYSSVVVAVTAGKWIYSSVAARRQPASKSAQALRSRLHRGKWISSRVGFAVAPGQADLLTRRARSGAGPVDLLTRCGCGCTGASRSPHASCSQWRRASGSAHALWVRLHWASRSTHVLRSRRRLTSRSTHALGSQLPRTTRCKHL